MSRWRHSALRGFWSGRAQSAALGIGGIVVLLALWWLGHGLFASQDAIAQRFEPQAAFESLWQLLQRPVLLEHISVSLVRVLVGLALALLIGIPLGLLVGSLRWLDTATTPAFQFLRMISPLSWMPIAVMVLGVGDKPIYFLLTFAALWPIVLNTAAGVKQLDARWLQLTRSLSATRLVRCWLYEEESRPAT